MKICTKCMEEKSLSEFKKNARCRDGVIGSCKVCMNAYTSQWRAANPGHPKGNRSEVLSRYYENNKEKVLAFSSQYRKDNLGKYAFYAQTRWTRKLNATPAWLTEVQLKEIENFYLLAKWYEEEMHVDHIVPLQGKNVCGLHVPWNLQLLPAIENIKKGNRFENVPA